MLVTLKLPPVFKKKQFPSPEPNGTPVDGDGTRKMSRFCFESESWKECIEVCVELTQVHRQRDERFIKMLNEIRRGVVSPESEKLLMNCTRNDFSTCSLTSGGGDSATAEVEPTRLYSTNKNVDALNHERLSALAGKGMHPVWPI